jgi:hypothetical protein
MIVIVLMKAEIQKRSRWLIEKYLNYVGAHSVAAKKIP